MKSIFQGQIEKLLEIVTEKEESIDPNQGVKWICQSILDLYREVEKLKVLK